MAAPRRRPSPSIPATCCGSSTAARAPRSCSPSRWRATAAGVTTIKGRGRAVPPLCPPWGKEVGAPRGATAAGPPGGPEVLTERKPKEGGAPAEAEGKKAPAAAPKKAEAPKKTEKEK